MYTTSTPLRPAVSAQAHDRHGEGGSTSRPKRMADMRRVRVRKSQCEIGSEDASIVHFCTSNYTRCNPLLPAST